MNYILQLTAFYNKIKVDKRIKVNHICLYHALFQFWNRNRFRNPVIVNRQEAMKYCKIGSSRTFYKCLNDLYNWGYIQYLPTIFPAKGSLVNMLIFETPTSEGKSHEGDKPTGDLCKIDIGTGAESTLYRCKNAIVTGAKMHPSLNNINILNNKTYREGEIFTQNFKNEILNSSNAEFKISNIDDRNSKRKKVPAKKEKIFEPPTLEMVLVFFSDSKYPRIEARKFYFYYQSIYWRVGGKYLMKDWEAAANNWMLNVTKFEKFTGPTMKKLSQYKDYGMPL